MLRTDDQYFDLCHARIPKMGIAMHAPTMIALVRSVIRNPCCQVSS